MALVALNEFDTYSNNFESDNDLVAMKNDIIEAASDIVIDFLGYNPICHQYQEVQTGIGSNKLFMEARPITDVSLVSVDGVAQNIHNITFKDDQVFTKDGSKIFKCGSTICINYMAGTCEAIAPIKMAVLRIASLMLLEANGNIGLSGRTFADQSRSYINYSNYDKYLQPLSYLKTRIL